MKNATQTTIHTVVLLGQVFWISCASAQQVVADEQTPQYMATGNIVVSDMSKIHF